MVWRSVWLGLTAAMASGLLYWLAFPPYSQWWISLLCWVPILLAREGGSLRRAFALGYVHGLGCLVAATWMTDAIQRLLLVSRPLALAMTFAVCAFHACRSAFALALVHALRRWSPLWLAAGVGVACVECVFPMVFPWYTACQVTSRPELVQVAELGGPFAVTLVLLAVNGAIAATLFGRRTLTEWAPPSLLFFVVAIYGILRIRSFEEGDRARPMTVAVLQGNAAQDGSDGLAVKRFYVEESRRLAKEVDLVVWPETAITQVAHPGAERAPWAREVVRGAEKQAPLLVGAVTERERRLYNSAILYDPDNASDQVYDKVHPFPIGETIPFSDSMPWLKTLVPGAGQVAHGSVTMAFDVQGVRTLPLICYEDLDPEAVATAVGATKSGILVNLTDDAWFGHSNAWRLHLELAKLRAVENRKFLVRATNQGGTAILDPTGRTVAELSPYVRSHLVARVWPMPEGTVFQTMARAAILPKAAAMATSAAILATLVHRRRRRSRETTLLALD